MLRENGKRALLLWWLPVQLLLLPSCSALSGSGSESLGPRCIDCGDENHAIGADCITNNSDQTITCGINATSCGYVQCAELHSCIFVFSIYHGNWFFDSICFKDGVIEDECHLERINREDLAFPPLDGMICQCNNAEDCSFSRGPLVYVHDHSPSKATSVPIMPPSPTPDFASTAMTGSTLGGVIAALAVVTAIVTMILLYTIIFFYRSKIGKRKNDDDVRRLLEQDYELESAGYNNLDLGSGFQPLPLHSQAT